MEPYQLLTIIGANLVVLMGFLSVTISLYLNSNKQINAIHQEMKDFHGRLCAIEERRK